jgi:hypothetical protein
MILMIEYDFERAAEKWLFLLRGALLLKIMALLILRFIFLTCWIVIKEFKNMRQLASWL